MARLVALITLLAVALAPSAAQAAGLAATKRVLAREMARAGGVLAAPTWSISAPARSSTPPRPTSAACPRRSRSSTRPRGALLRYGPEGRLTTTVLADRAARRDRHDRRQRRPARRRRPDLRHRRVGHAWPSSSPHAGLQRIEGRVIGDESAFDAFRGVPSSGYRLTSEVGPLSALSFNHGRTGKRAPVLPGQPGPLRRPGVREGARARGREDHRHGPRRASPPPA